MVCGGWTNTVLRWTHTHTFVKCRVIFDKRHLLTAIFFNLGFVDMQRQTIKDNGTCPQSDAGTGDKSSLDRPIDVNSVITELTSSGKHVTSTGWLYLTRRMETSTAPTVPLTQLYFSRSLNLIVFLFQSCTTISPEKFVLHITVLIKKTLNMTSTKNGLHMKKKSL